MVVMATDTNNPCPVTTTTLKPIPTPARVAAGCRQSILDAMNAQTPATAVWALGIFLFIHFSLFAN
jgi:hypothetical protein